MPQTLSLLDLKIDRPDRPGWDTVWGSIFAQMASVCIESVGSGIESILEVNGNYSETILIVREILNDSARRFNADMQRSTEFGAYAISSLVVPELTGLTVIEASKKGTGFDFWLGAINDTGPLFQRKARLEVSGILKGSQLALNSRVKQKTNQISPTDDTPYPGYISVVKFLSFEMILVKKDST